MSETENPFAHSYSEKRAFETLEDIKGKKVTVMGLGLNGGGEAVVRFLSKYGAEITITDMKSEEQLAPTIKSLSEDKSIDSSKIRYVLGRHELSDFENADVVIKNPGVKYAGNKYLAAAKAIETDLSIFLHFTKAPIIAVTGSKGKSSTVSAIHYGLSNLGFTSFLGGNITVSPLTFLEQTNENTPVVLELSSWQLSDLRGRKLLKPKVAVITKIVPDHQNWYGNMENYVADKKLIYADQDENDFSIFTCDDKWGDLFASESKGFVLRYSDHKPSKNGCWLNEKSEGWLQIPGEEKSELVLDKLAVPGRHMRENILNAALVLRLFGCKAEDIKVALEKFPGVPHRLEFFHEWKNQNGITFKFFNDSAATVPEAAVAAMESFGVKPVMVCGGTDKELDFHCFAEKANLARKLFLLSGTGTDKLLPLIDQKGVAYEKPNKNLDELFSNLKPYLEVLESEDKEIPVVFSPGATSFGMFNNEFDRGNKYKAGVKAVF
ncbi:MAG: UDP-N-acetylmuramoyl-L-alanine--D-glutamate ligase [Treponemataceae bacterium]|nr:UDP-N-acetylmuramoyl-L-alanine--D-glutamate ligase [Treponemataceae bacterium]